MIASAFRKLKINHIYQSFSTKSSIPPTKQLKPETNIKNVVTAAVLLSFVGIVYYTAIAKMAQTVSY